MFQSPRDLMFFTFVTLSLGIACSNANEDDGTKDDDSSAVGGYTGLGTYTGVSGVYGSGGVSSAGTTGKGGATTTSVGGATATTTGGATTAGGASGSAGGSASGGTSASAGGKTSAGGTSSSGGATATGGKTAAGGSSSSQTFTWPDAYNPNGTAPVASGEHRPGTNCMTSTCHGPTTGTRAFAFGGTIYQTNGTTAAAHIQIAIVSGTKTLTTYTATNGNFWLPLASASGIDWTTARVYLRSAAGETIKAADEDVGSACNSCHGASARITAP